MTKSQPLDVGVNRPYKQHYSEMWQNWFEEIIKDHTGKSSFSSPSKELMISWVWKAGRKITEDCIQNSFNLFRNVDHLIRTNN